ncbi:MAG: ABC transporter permease [Inconstantimicrobium porci]|uniref:ABC transporter permease n=1 Tax=Inconstantimicrobium porci TaxID=2652291 RepID=A0A7X2MZT6_9CLOT|nr:ABC transporter permease [Inconstantimicrobium porci]MDD6770360.1 ABC transporter permease [Inconstantimicrobium porci]MDY5911217.1 ABC transporter permease [Inconstantimicrobium porci]MSR92137.1 ABC transporter permease [Inconstantimicrobium porci]
MFKKAGIKLYTLLIFLFLYAPIFALILFSFNDSKSMGVWKGFTLKWYISLFNNKRILTALYYTVFIALSSAVISTVIGTISSIGIFKMKKNLRNITLNITNIPVLNPDIVTGIALMSLFGFINLKLGLTSLLLAHITFGVPYVILSVLPKLRQLPNNLEEAALDLGATPSYALRKIIFPLIKPGIASGFLMAFTMSIDDFVISFFTAGPGVTNLSIEVYSMAKRGIKPEINALSTLMFLVVLILLLIINKKGSNEGGNQLEIY